MDVAADIDIDLTTVTMSAAEAGSPPQGACSMPDLAALEGPEGSAAREVR